MSEGRSPRLLIDLIYHVLAPLCLMEHRVRLKICSGQQDHMHSLVDELRMSELSLLWSRLIDHVAYNAFFTAAVAHCHVAQRFALLSATTIGIAIHAIRTATKKRRTRTVARAFFASRDAHRHVAQLLALLHVLGTPLAVLPPLIATIDDDVIVLHVLHETCAVTSDEEAHMSFDNQAPVSSRTT